MKKVKLLLILPFFAIFITSCSKNSVKPDKPGKTDSTINVGAIVTGGPGVYATGHDASKADPANLSGFATLWKNGKAYRLSNGAFNATGNSVYADDKNVYVAGFETNSAGIQVAKLWVNGVGTDLTDGKHNAEANSVVVSGGKVYVAGFEDSATAAAKLWVNNVATTLNSGTLATSVYVYKGDVYVTGSTSNANAVIWKNGVVTVLDGSGAQDYPPTSIFVAQNHVYVTGDGSPTNNLMDKWLLKLDSVNQANIKSDLFDRGGSYLYEFPYHIGVIWKDGAADNPVLSGDYQALTYARSVFVNGSDVYIAGGNLQTNVATLWKNGASTNLSVYPNQSIAYSVYASGSDVYVAGMATNANGKRVATLWKNNVATNIGNSDEDKSTPGQNGGGQANSVFVLQ